MGLSTWTYSNHASLLWDIWRKNYDVYIKCINGRFALPITFLITRLRKKPFVLWTGIWTRLQTPFHRLAWSLTYYIYKHADAIVIYGEHVKRYLISEGIPADRIFVAPNVIDNQFYRCDFTHEEKDAFLQQLGVNPQEKTILYVGRLESIKGLSYLIESFGLLMTNNFMTKLIITGDGSQKVKLIQLVKDRDLEKHALFTGYIPTYQMPILYAIASGLVLPSITTPYGKELWRLVINEAFNQGVPVIATDAAGAVAGGLVDQTGLVVPERDSIALAKAIKARLSDQELRIRLGQNAKHRIEYLNFEHMVQSFNQAIEHVTSRQAF